MDPHAGANKRLAVGKLARDRKVDSIKDSNSFVCVVFKLHKALACSRPRVLVSWLTQTIRQAGSISAPSRHVNSKEGAVLNCCCCADTAAFILVAVVIAALPMQPVALFKFIAHSIGWPVSKITDSTPMNLEAKVD